MHMDIICSNPYLLSTWPDSENISLIEVAELDGNVTKNERSQQNAASPEVTYNQPWQTVDLNVVHRGLFGIQHPQSVMDTLIDR